MTYRTGTIPEIHRQLAENGYHVTENALRVWVKKGFLKAAYSGNRRYILYENVLDILTNGTPDTNTDGTTGGIRRIPC